MKDPKRIDIILSLIREIWIDMPDLRLTQLIMNVLGIHEDPYYIEDNVLLEKIEKLKKQSGG